MSKGRKTEERIKLLSLSEILPPELAVRKTMNREKLEQLKSSILRVGLQQPIIVKTVKGGGYEIVMGERRFVAHKELELDKIRAIVSTADDYDYEVAKYDENNAREDVNAMDEARFISRLNRKFKKSQKELAAELGKSEAYISQRIKIINAPAIIQDALEDGIISFSVARELAQIDDEQEIKHLLYFASQNGVTPNVARSWRLQYEAKKAAGGIAGEYGPSDPSGGDVNAGSVFSCGMCEKDTEINRMKIIKVCPECYQTVKTAT